MLPTDEKEIQPRTRTPKFVAKALLVKMTTTGLFFYSPGSFFLTRSSYWPDPEDVLRRSAAAKLLALAISILKKREKITTNRSSVARR